MHACMAPHAVTDHFARSSLPEAVHADVIALCLANDPLDRPAFADLGQALQRRYTDLVVDSGGDSDGGGGGGDGNGDGAVDPTILYNRVSPASTASLRRGGDISDAAVPTGVPGTPCYRQHSVGTAASFGGALRAAEPGGGR